MSWIPPDAPRDQGTFLDYKTGLPKGCAPAVTTTTTTSTPSKMSGISKHIPGTKAHEAKRQQEELGDYNRSPTYDNNVRSSTYDNGRSPTYDNNGSGIHPSNYQTGVQQGTHPGYQTGIQQGTHSGYQTGAPHGTHPLRSNAGTGVGSTGVYDDMPSGIEESVNPTGGAGTAGGTGVRQSVGQNVNAPTGYGQPTTMGQKSRSPTDSAGTSTSRHVDTARTGYPTDPSRADQNLTSRHADTSRSSYPVDTTRTDPNLTSRYVESNRTSYPTDTTRSSYPPDTSRLDQGQTSRGHRYDDARRPGHDNYDGLTSGQHNQMVHPANQDSGLQRYGNRETVPYNDGVRSIPHQIGRDDYYGSRPGYGNPAFEASQDHEDFASRMPATNMTQSTTITTPSGYTTTTTTTPHTSRPHPEERNAVAGAMQSPSVTSSAVGVVKGVQAKTERIKEGINRRADEIGEKAVQRKYGTSPETDRAYVDGRP